MKKIDVFNHIWPKPFFDRLVKELGTMTHMTKRSGDVPMMTDLDRRFQVMDMFGLTTNRSCRLPLLRSRPLPVRSGTRAVKIAPIRWLSWCRNI